MAKRLEQIDAKTPKKDTVHDGRTVLVVRGTDRPLRVDVRDADGQADKGQIIFWQKKVNGFLNGVDYC